jgi:Protein of unknown function (DUF1214)
MPSIQRTTNEERAPNMKTISTMRTRTTLTTAIFLAVSAVFLGTLTFGLAHAQQGPASGTLVTQENYCRAENSHMFAAGVKRAGGVNRFDHFRSVTPPATYTVPENKGFWSITVYGADGYMKNANSVLNKYNTKFNPDGTFTAYFGSEEICGDVPNRLDAPEGWNFLMRVYRPGESVLHGSYTLPDAVAAKK